MNHYYYGERDGDSFLVMDTGKVALAFEVRSRAWAWSADVSNVECMTAAELTAWYPNDVITLDSDDWEILEHIPFYRLCDEDGNVVGCSTDYSVVINTIYDGGAAFAIDADGHSVEV